MKVVKFHMSTAAAALVAAFIASTASAAFVATNNFESALDAAEFTTHDAGVSLTDISTVTDYASDEPSVGAPAPFANYGSKYLAVDTDDAMLWRTFDSRSATTYFDSVVKFSPTAGDVEYPADSKFVVFLDAATSNLFVVSGTSAGDRMPVTNRLANVTVYPDTWRRLTINAVPESSVFAFQVRVDGMLLATADATPVSTFYSLASGASLSEVGFKGTGAVDDFVVRTTPPAVDGAAAKIGDEDFATLEDALEVATADTVITLVAGHPATIYLSDVVTYKVNPGACAFGGFAATPGYTLTEGEPISGTTTYSCAATKVGDTVKFSNSGTLFAADAAASATATLMIPATENLPADSIVAITSISIGSRNSAFKPDVAKGDASSVKVVDKDGVTKQSAVISGYNGTIAANASTAVGRLTYTFTPAVQVVVGRSHDVTLCKSDGSPHSSGTGYGAGAKMVQTSDGSSVLSFAATVATGWYPVYEVEGSVLGVPSAQTTISESVNASGLSWSPAVLSDPAQGAVLNVTANATLTLDQALEFADVTINVSSGVTLTLQGANSVVGATVTISGGRVLSARTAISGVLSGDGEVVYTGNLPSGITIGSGWTGVVTLANISGIKGNDCDFDSYGNETSSVKLMGVSGWVAAQHTYTVPIILEDDVYGYALKLTDGNSPQSADYSQAQNVNRCTIFAKVSGTGTLTDSTSAWPVVKIYDASEFAGSISNNTAVTIFCTEAGDATLNDDTIYNIFSSKKGKVYVASNVSLTNAVQKKWYATNGVTVNGTLAVNGEISGGCFGSGEVIYDGKLPPTGVFTADGWAGTVKVKSVGSAAELDLSQYGNANSAIELAGVGLDSVEADGPNTHFKKGFTYRGKLVLTDDGDTKALTLNNGYSDSCITIGELAGSGTLRQVNKPSSAITQGIVINVMTNYTGSGNLLPNHMPVTFGTKTSRYDSGHNGKLYIDSDAKISVQAGFALWSPTKFEFDGPVNFTTNATDYNGLVLFTNVGSDVTFGSNAAVTVNGQAVKGYQPKVKGTSIVLERKGAVVLFF